MKPLSVLLVGTGRMAETHARRFAEIPGVAVTAAVDLVPERLDAFCDAHRIAGRFESVEAALAAGSFDALSVVTPDSAHQETCIPGVEAGLAVLCEKPLSDSIESAHAMVQAAASTAALNMVNLTYRQSGALAEAQRLVAEGCIGELRHVDAAYRQSWLVSPYWGDWKSEDAWLWRLSTRHGSQGVLGDIGIHVLDFVMAGAGLGISGLQCRLHTFDKAPQNRIGDYVLDANDSCIINAQFDNGALGVVHLSRFATGHRNDIEMGLHGTRGALRVSLGEAGDVLSVCVDGDHHQMKWTTRVCDPAADTFERFVDSVRSGEPCQPDFAHAARLQTLLHSCVESHEQGRWLEL